MNNLRIDPAQYLFEAIAKSRVVLRETRLAILYSRIDNRVFEFRNLLRRRRYYHDPDETSYRSVSDCHCDT